MRTIFGSRLCFMSAIICFGALSVASHAQVLLADAEKQAPIYQACAQLAKITANEYANQEGREKIRCLNSNRISATRYDRLLADFSEDCTNAVVVKLGPQYDQYGDHDIRFSRNELSAMFDRHYRGVYDQYCSSWGTGENTTSQPRQVE